MKRLTKLEEVVSAWPHVSVGPHRFGGREFRFASAELGHTHTGGIIDIPFPLSIQGELLVEGLAEKHKWSGDSGWVTFRVRREEDLQHALWLMRLSYVRYLLNMETDRSGLLGRASKALHLSTHLRSLLESIVTANQVPAEALSRSLSDSDET